jgi:hypothetical protein
MDAVAQGNPAYELKHFSMQVDLQCHEEGVLSKSVEHASGAWIRALPTFWMLNIFVEEGDRLEPTRSFETSPGYVILIGPDAAAVEKDLELIRQRERSGLMYQLREPSEPDAGPAMLHQPSAISVSERKGSLLSVPDERRRSSFSNSSNRPRVLSTCKAREMDMMGDKLLSPLVSRASSPVLSPLQAPQLPPGVDALGEFSLDGLDGDEGTMEFKIEGLDSTPKQNGATVPKPSEVLDGFSLDG